MAAQNRYATLESDLMGKGAEAPAALPSRRRTADRLTGRAPAPGAAPHAPARAVELTAPAMPASATAAEHTAGDVFYDKGAATAANFRPSYWTYDQATPQERAHAAATTPTTAEVVELAPSLPASKEPPPAAEDQREEPPAVVGVPVDSAAVVDELAATIEHVLSSRYASTRPAPDSAPKPRLVASAVTADSLMAELKEARQARAGQGKPAAPLDSVHPARKAPSLFDRVFALGGIALVLFVALLLSPWRDSFLPPTIAHFFG